MLFIPKNLYTVPEVMAKTDCTAEEVLQWGATGDVFFLVMAISGASGALEACQVPKEAMRHFVAGADSFTVNAMAAVYSDELFGPWTIKRDSLRIVGPSWDAFHAAETATIANDLIKLETAPVVATGASGGVKPDKAGPLPLTTGDIAFCFAGLSWNEQEWKKPLGDKPKWLSACIAIPAVRGVSESRWNPVLIGASLVRVRHVKPKSVRAQFQTQPLLKPWLDEWKTYEADNLSAD